MTTKILSLQGIFFQQGHVMGVGYKSEFGMVATIRDDMCYGMFHGVVSEEAGEWTGSMSDHVGSSDIRAFSATDDSITFEKHYKNRQVINYVFTKKKDGIWYGSYFGKDCGTGSAKLIVTEIDESFFEPAA